MKTSYFANPKVKRNPNAISIARWAPRWWGDGRRGIDLAPPIQLLRVFKSGHISAQEYAECFKKNVLDKLNPEDIYKKYSGKILCCYELPGEFCHRRLIAAWIEESLGIKVPELRGGDNDTKSQS